MSHGNLFIISAPSGTGKTTILKAVMSDLKKLVFSVSHTTRKPRANEIDGKDYHFVTHDSFKEMQAEDAFMEWAHVHDNYYGTSDASVDGNLAQGIDVVLDIDVQGAKQIKESNKCNTVFIFIMPPSWDELEARLKGRGTDSSETINLRLDNASKEIQDADFYDYVVVNDHIEDAVEGLRSIIIAERIKKSENLPLVFP